MSRDPTVLQVEDDVERGEVMVTILSPPGEALAHVHLPAQQAKRVAKMIQDSARRVRRGPRRWWGMW